MNDPQPTTPLPDWAEADLDRVAALLAAALNGGPRC
jgi:hypothetical protein